MTPTTFPESTHLFTAEGCGDLPVHVDQASGSFISAWKVTPEDLNRIVETGIIYLSVMGGQPPVAVFTESPFVGPLAPKPKADNAQPDAVREAVESSPYHDGYKAAVEYIRELIADEERESAPSQESVEKGRASGAYGDAGPMTLEDEEFWRGWGVAIKRATDGYEAVHECEQNTAPIDGGGGDWVAIHSEADLPKECGYYWFHTRDGEFTEINQYGLSDTSERARLYVQEFAYWAPVRKPSPPAKTLEPDEKKPCGCGDYCTVRAYLDEPAVSEEHRPAAEDAGEGVKLTPQERGWNAEDALNELKDSLERTMEEHKNERLA